MARKKILDSYSCKFSINVIGDNKKILDELTENYMVKYGPMINKIISSFCRMPHNVKKVIEKSCFKEYERLTKEILHTDELSYHYFSLVQERDTYMEILRLLNGGVFNFQEECNHEASMKKIKIADGYLIIPDDWIIVNPERAEYSRYAAVIECLNSDKYGVPHFIYFNDFKTCNEYTERMEKDFINLCTKKWSKFKEIKHLSDLNQLIPDPDNEGCYLNADEHLNAPIIGFFHIPEYGDSSYSKPPYGAIIVRTGTSEDEEE